MVEGSEPRREREAVSRLLLISFRRRITKSTYPRRSGAQIDSMVREHHYQLRVKRPLPLLSPQADQRAPSDAVINATGKLSRLEPREKSKSS